MGSYPVYLILQDDKKVVYQNFEGCLRGKYNLIGYQLNPKEFLKLSELEENPIDLNNDREMDLIIHNNLSFYSYFNPKLVSESKDLYYSSMADITDFPVPYFYDGEKLSYNRDEGKKYYLKFLILLNDADKKHKLVISHWIEKYLLKNKLRKSLLIDKF